LISLGRFRWVAFAFTGCKLLRVPQLGRPGGHQRRVRDVLQHSSCSHGRSRCIGEPEKLSSQRSAHQRRPPGRCQRVQPLARPSALLFSFLQQIERWGRLLRIVRHGRQRVALEQSANFRVARLALRTGYTRVKDIGRALQNGGVSLSRTRIPLFRANKSCMSCMGNDDRYEYEFTVTATNQYGESLPSFPVKARPMAGLPNCGPAGSGDRGVEETVTTQSEGGADDPDTLSTLPSTRHTHHPRMPPHVALSVRSLCTRPGHSSDWKRMLSAVCVGLYRYGGRGGYGYCL
jgi:hypothetical protein